MSYANHHTLHSTKILLLLHIDNGNTTTATHTANKKIAVVGGKDCTSQSISTTIITVYMSSKAIVQRKYIVHDI